eukprot:jgi/Bigna1/146094/aug1.108_g20802
METATPESAKALIYRTVVFCSMTSMLLGYDVGIMAGALPNMVEDLQLSTTEEEVIAGSLNIVAGLCAVLAGYTADKLGRKKALGIACIVFALGAGVMTAATNFAILFIGRIITGVGVGFGVIIIHYRLFAFPDSDHHPIIIHYRLVIAPLYLSEVVPPEKRGFLVCLFDVILNVGILEGYIVGYAVQVSINGAGTRWRLMIAIAILPPLMIIAGLFSLAESPRWLMQVGRESEALVVMSKMIPDPDAVQKLQREIKDVIAAETSNSYSDVLCPDTRALKAALHISLGLAIAQQITGSEAVIYYTPEIMKSAGISNQSEQAMQFITLFFLSLSFLYKWGFASTIVFVSAFMFFFEVAAPISWLMPSEVYSTGKRGKAQSAAVTLNRIVSGTIAISFLSISKALTVPGTFFLFCGIAFIVTVWYFFVVPETKGLTLEEITSHLGQQAQTKTSVNDDENYESVNGFKDDYFEDHTDQKGRDIGDI